MTKQPRWKCIQATDYDRVLVDETGVYVPEMEIAEEAREGRFKVFRFSLDRLKEVNGFLVPFTYGADWPHPVASYEEWFADDLPDVERTCGLDPGTLRALLLSDEPLARAEAYECIGQHHGFVNLDSDPLMLTENELDARWSKEERA